MYLGDAGSAAHKLQAAPARVGAIYTHILRIYYAECVLAECVVLCAKSDLRNAGCQKWTQ